MRKPGLSGHSKKGIRDSRNVRDISLCILLEVKLNGKKLQPVLNRVYDELPDLKPAEKAFISRLVYMTLERLITIDAVLALFAVKSLRRTRPEVLMILRLSCCQLLYFDHIPDYSVCDEAQKLVVLHGYSGLKAFVNAMLRSILREMTKQEGQDASPVSGSAGTDCISAENTKGNTIGNTIENTIGNSIENSIIDPAGRILSCPALNRLLSDKSIRYSVPAWLYTYLAETFGTAKADDICLSWLIPRKTQVRIRKIHEAFSADKACNECTTDKTGSAADKTDDPAYKADESVEARIVRSLTEDHAQPEKTDILKIIETSGSDRPAGELFSVYELHNGTSVTELEAFKKGWIYAEDASAALLGPFADPRDGERIIDVCAAPGGKTLQLSEMANVHIEARDVSGFKTALIEENIKRCHAKGINVSVHDALTDDEDSYCRADILIADLPCSGLGVLNGKPDIKLSLCEYSINELASLQRDILTVASRYVKPHGRLVYSTCTISKEENEENASWITEFLGFEKLSTFSTLPGPHNDGFFISVFRRKH